MLAKQLITLGIDRITIRKMMESILTRRALCKNICIDVLTTWDLMVSLTMFQQHLLIRPTEPKKREEYRWRTMKIYSPFGLNVEDSV